MLDAALILAAAGIITALELPRMIKEKERKEIWAFSALLLISIGISLMQAFVPEVPTPLKLITIVFKPFSDLLSAIGLIQS